MRRETPRMHRLKYGLRVSARAVPSVFSPPNMRNAFKSVLSNWKEYICFYIAALAVTAGFCLIALLTDTNLREAERLVRADYDYHIAVVHLDQEQKQNLYNQLNLALSREDPALAAASFRSESDGTYTAHIRLNAEPDLPSAYAHIHKEYLSRVTIGERVIRTTPLYTFDEDYRIPYTVQFWAVMLGFLGLSVLMLTVLYRIRLDHFRFLYGMYMTCGADFARLFGAAGGELLAISTLTVIPGCLIGLGAAAGLYLPRGVPLSLSVRSAITLPLILLLSVFLSVWHPMRKLSKRPPVELLTAPDHTPLVSSPRRSFRLIGQTFPGKYELYGFWRMRKYYARLVVSAVLFAALFVSGLYVADLERYHNRLDTAEYLVRYDPAFAYETDPEGESDTSAPTPETTGKTPAETTRPPLVQLTPEEADMVRTDADAFLPDLNAVEGVSHVMWSVTERGASTMSHLLLKPTELHHAGAYTVHSEERRSEGYTVAMNNYAYTAVDENWIAAMEQHNLCTFEGDPRAALNDPRQIIVSEDVYNRKAFDFHPGDTILVAVCERTQPFPLVLDSKELLRKQISNYGFRYEVCTVCAVMRGMPSGYDITFGLNYDAFAAFAGKPAVRSELQVYMENGTPMPTVHEAEARLSAIAGTFSGWSVTPTGRFFRAELDGLKQDHALILMVAGILLIVSPLVWFFSQALFYRKRQGEYAILFALGAPRPSFGRLHRMAGGVLAGAAFLLTVGLASLGNGLAYLLVNTVLPGLHLVESVHYQFELSGTALFACAAVSVLCGYLSTVIPYYLITRRHLPLRGSGRPPVPGNPSQPKENCHENQL